MDAEKALLVQGYGEMQQVLPSGADGRERVDLLTGEDQEGGWAVRFPRSGAAIHDQAG